MALNSRCTVSGLVWHAAAGRVETPVLGAQPSTPPSVRTCRRSQGWLPEAAKCVVPARAISCFWQASPPNVGHPGAL